MLLNYTDFYKRFGIRMAQQLLAPRLFRVDEFHFPKSSTLHFVSHDPEIKVPNPTEAYFKGFNKRILMDVITDYVDGEGPFRKVVRPLNNLVGSFFLKNRNFKYVKNVNKFNKDQTTLSVIDYGYLHDVYRYPNGPLSHYFEWVNIERTAWKKIAEEAKTSDRQNFIFYNVPDVIPSISTLNNFSSVVNQNLTKILDTPEKKFILQLWKWISPLHREDSIFNHLNSDELNKVNIVFVYRGLWCVLNLGVFDSWRKVPDKDELLTDTVKKPTVDKSHSVKTTIKHTPQQLQRIFLRMLIGIQSQIIPEQSEALTDSNEQPSDLENQSTASKQKLPEEQTKLRPLEEVEQTIEKELIDENELLEIEKDLEALEIIEKRSLMAKGVLVKDVVNNTTDVINEEPAINVEEVIFKEKSPEEYLKSIIDKHSEYGLMSASEYRSLVKQTDSFMKQGNPYTGDVSIKEYIDIKPETLTISEQDTQFKDYDTIVDKSMLSSSLKVFDKKYITEVLSKDITSMAVNIQKAGIIIQDYSVETDNSILGEYEMHTLKIKPIDGVASTLRFKLPKLDKEGKMTAGGNRYNVRKQRSD